MTRQALSADKLDLLRGVDTPTICNCIELFDVRPRNTGYLDGRIRSCFPELGPMVGYASTATFRSDAPPRAGEAYASLEAQVRAFEQVAAPVVVVFQDLDDPPVAATFGEVMCATYKAFGAAGIVTSGAGRDLEQVRALGFPAFTAGTICAHAYCQIVEVHVPVHVGGLTIYPGDLLHGDANGITTIPHEIAGPLARITRDFIACEEEVLSLVKGPKKPTPDQLADARAKMSAGIKKLAERAKGEQTL